MILVSVCRIKGSQISFTHSHLLAEFSSLSWQTNILIYTFLCSDASFNKYSVYMQNNWTFQRSGQPYNTICLLPFPYPTVLLPAQPLHSQHVPWAACDLWAFGQLTLHPNLPPQCHLQSHHLHIWLGPCSFPVALHNHHHHHHRLN